MSLQSIRQKIKQERLALPEPERAHLSHQIFQNFKHLPDLLHCKDIALYYPMNGEVDTTEIINYLWHMRIQCFLPVVHKLPIPTEQRLLFAPYTPNSKMHNNKFGIPEPQVSQRELRHAHDLDMIVMPLVAFDNKGNRLGTGGGYYDRTLAEHLTHTKLHTPKLIGLAYEFQQVKTLIPHKWDVPMDAVVTEKETYEFANN